MGRGPGAEKGGPPEENLGCATLLGKVCRSVERRSAICWPEILLIGIGPHWLREGVRTPYKVRDKLLTYEFHPFFSYGKL